MIRQFHRNESSWNVRSRGTKVPRERMFHGTKFPQERKFQGANVPWNESSTGAKVLSMVFSLPGTKVQRNEKAWNLWPMQYVFLIRSSTGGKKYVTRSRVTYFLPPARERIKNTYCMGQRLFLVLLLIYYAKFQRYFTQKHGTLFIADVVWIGLPTSSG